MPRYDGLGVCLLPPALMAPSATEGQSHPGCPLSLCGLQPERDPASSQACGASDVQKREGLQVTGRLS